MTARLFSMGLFGLETYTVEVEADISRGLPAFDIVGLPDTAVRESRERVRAAMKNCGWWKAPLNGRFMILMQRSIWLN